MKHLLTLLFLLLSTSALFAQSNTEELEKLLESGQLSRELLEDLLSSPPPAMFNNTPSIRGKNNNQLERRLDSTIVHQHYYENTLTKTQYHYNEAGIVDSATSFIHYQDNGDIVPQFLITYRVNNSFQLTEEVFHFWSPDEQLWIEYMTKTKVKYDSYGNKTESILAGNSLFGLALIVESKLNYNYDDDLLISTEFHAKFISSDDFEISEEFESLSKAYYTYNSNNDLSKIIYTKSPYGMDSIYLENHFLYDSLKRHTETIDYRLLENNDYEIRKKIEYYYDENSLNTETIYSRYEEGAITTKRKNNRFYNEEFLPFKTINYIFNWEEDEWEALEKRTYTLNPNYDTNYLIALDNALAHNHHFQAYYDSNLEWSSFFFPLSVSKIGKLEYEITNENHYQWFQSDWQTYKQQKYYYSDFILPFQAGSNTISINYPNPAIDHVSFDTNLDPTKVNVHFFDMAGAEILSSPLPDDKTIHTDNLKTGTYYYQLINKETKEVLYAGKILKH